MSPFEQRCPYCIRGFPCRQTLKLVLQFSSFELNSPDATPYDYDLATVTRAEAEVAVLAVGLNSTLDNTTNQPQKPEVKIDLRLMEDIKVNVSMAALATFLGDALTFIVEWEIGRGTFRLGKMEMPKTNSAGETVLNSLVPQDVRFMLVPDVEQGRSVLLAMGVALDSPAIGSDLGEDDLRQKAFLLQGVCYKKVSLCLQTRLHYERGYAGRRLRQHCCLIHHALQDDAAIGFRHLL